MANSRRCAFTLIELLVIIAIIGILAALQLPTLSKAKQFVKRIVCQHHLRQWGTATAMYTLDNDDWLPPDGSPNGTSKNGGWYIDLPPYVAERPYNEQEWRTNENAQIDMRRLWFCPSNPRRSNGQNLFHYALNQNVNDTGNNNAPIKLSSIEYPIKTVWIYDSKNRPAVGSWNFFHTNLHADGGNIVFLDAHTTWVRTKKYDSRDRTYPTGPNSEITWFP